MPTIVPHKELARRALKWISQEHTDTGKPVKRLIEEACVRFNLGPKDAEYLEKMLSGDQVLQDVDPT